MSDYLVCLHTCETCICDTTMTILWPKKHGSIQCHAINLNRHPFCTADCPGNIYLLKNSVKNTWDSRAIHLPTKQEYEDNVTMELHGSGQLIDSGTGVSFRQLRVLYVTDPVQGESNKIRANTDHSFMKTLISYHDWLDVWNLMSYVHGPVTEPDGQWDICVLIYEWVSL